MKNLLQCVSIVAIGLLMAPTALEAALCGPASQSTACPMAAHDMGPNCPMTGASASSNCPENCCAARCLPKVLPWARPVRPKVSIPQTAIMPLILAAANPVRALPRPVNAAASSPPRFILFQVFRI